MAEPADQEFLRSIFLMEAGDTVAALEGAAATLARPGGQDALFVVTHRLKGAASLHGFPKIAELAAELEEELAGQPLDTRALTTLVGHLKRALDAAAGAPAGRGVAEAAGGACGGRSGGSSVMWIRTAWLGCSARCTRSRARRMSLGVRAWARSRTAWRTCWSPREKVVVR